MTRHAEGRGTAEAVIAELSKMHVGFLRVLVSLAVLHAQVAEISKERFRLAAELEALQGVRAFVMVLPELTLRALGPLAVCQLAVCLSARKWQNCDKLQSLQVIDPHAIKNIRSVLLWGRESIKRQVCVQGTLSYP